jgi:hypothetical protein
MTAVFGRGTIYRARQKCLARWSHFTRARISSAYVECGSLPATPISGRPRPILGVCKQPQHARVSPCSEWGMQRGVAPLPTGLPGRPPVAFADEPGRSGAPYRNIRRCHNPSRSRPPLEAAPQHLPGRKLTAPRMGLRLRLQHFGETRGAPPRWLHDYNWHRPHASSAVLHLSPVTASIGTTR